MEGDGNGDDDQLLHNLELKIFQKIFLRFLLRMYNISKEPGRGNLYIYLCLINLLQNLAFFKMR